MKKVDWIKKLTSRKFWVTVAGFVAGIIIAFKGSSEIAESVSVYIFLCVFIKPLPYIYLHVS